MEKRFAGPKAILIQGLMSGTLDITRNGWTHQVIDLIDELNIDQYILSRFKK